MTYRAEVSFAPAHELIISLHMYLCKKSHRRLELGSAWVTETKKRLSADLLSQIEGLDGLEEWGELALLASKSPHQESTTQFLEWYAKLSVGEIYEHLSPWVQFFPTDLGQMRDRMIDLLSKWDEQYFQHVDPQILHGLRADAEEKQRLSHTMTAAEMAEETTNGLHFEPTDELEQILLIPQYHAQPGSHLKAFRGLTVCAYTSLQLPPTTPDDPPSALYRLTRCLADKTRLKILRLISQGPKTFVEIVSHLGMSKSTIHEHLFTLRSAGLIRAHVIGESATSYTIRKSSIDSLHGLLHEYVK